MCVGARAFECSAKPTTSSPLIAVMSVSVLRFSSSASGAPLRVKRAMCSASILRHCVRT